MAYLFYNQKFVSFDPLHLYFLCAIEFLLQLHILCQSVFSTSFLLTTEVPWEAENNWETKVQKWFTLWTLSESMFWYSMNTWTYWEQQYFSEIFSYVLPWKYDTEYILWIALFIKACFYTLSKLHIVSEFHSGAGDIFITT